VYERLELHKGLEVKVGGNNDDEGGSSSSSAAACDYALSHFLRHTKICAVMTMSRQKKMERIK